MNPIETSSHLPNESRAKTMDDPKARQERFNAESLDQWDGFAEHRRRVSDRLATGSGRLCVLGAGNANDLDLSRLIQAYREVHLVDLDAGALERAVWRQGVAARAGLIRHGGVDLTGMLDVMARWSPVGEVTGAELDALADWPPRRVDLALPGPFDVVASTCVLSQLIGNGHHALGEAHPQIDRVARAIRMGHLRLLASLARPGGRVVLITDVATSEKCPEIADPSCLRRSGLISELADRRGLIRGVNPYRILSLLRKDPGLSSILHRAELGPEWLWKLHDRAYLVVAIEARARETAGRLV